MEDEGVAASIEGDEEAEAFLDSRQFLQPHSMADTFVAVLAITNPGVKLPGTSIIARWFTDLNGTPSSEFGHTTLFPLKNGCVLNVLCGYSGASEAGEELGATPAAHRRCRQCGEAAGTIVRVCVSSK